MNEISQDVDSFLKDQVACLNDIVRAQEPIIRSIIELLIHARSMNSGVYTMGNGGSGSTASHLVSDLLKTAITKDDPRFKAVSLVDNVPVLLAWSNDTSYEEVFIEQLKNFLSKDDIVIGFSGSGKSKNVVKAMRYARENGAKVIGITGMSGGEFPKVSDICLIVPSDDMLLIESTHVIICHCIISAIRKLGKPVFTYG